MAKPKKDNRVKRKRGKKFVYHGEEAEGAEKEEKTNIAANRNPFEDHSKSNRARKDVEVRETMLKDFRDRGRNSTLVDNRLAEKSSKLSEEDKMKIRYMREQKDQLTKEMSLTHQTRKRMKFNLGGEDSDEDFNVLTHKGKKLVDIDDFKDKIDGSDDDCYEDKDL
jgi:hypothetical protein